jgi:hypothetical protein
VLLLLLLFDFAFYVLQTHARTPEAIFFCLDFGLIPKKEKISSPRALDHCCLCCSPRGSTNEMMRQLCSGQQIFTKKIGFCFI